MNDQPYPSAAFLKHKLRIFAYIYIAMTIVSGIIRSMTSGEFRVLVPLLFTAALGAWRLHSGKPLWLFPDELLVVLPLWCGFSANKFGIETTWFPGLGLLISMLCIITTYRTIAVVLSKGGFPAIALFLTPLFLLVFSTVLAKATGGADQMQLSSLYVQVGLAFGGVPVSWLAWPPQASTGISPEEPAG